MDMQGHYEAFFPLTFGQLQKSGITLKPHQIMRKWPTQGLLSAHLIGFQKNF
jgi:hypothetical protein